MKKIVNGQNGLVCAYCGKVKQEISFVIGASTKPDWCMIYGTGKMACPECYEKASKEGKQAVDLHVDNYNKACRDIGVEYSHKFDGPVNLLRK